MPAVKGTKIRELMESVGLDREALAVRTGIPAKTITNIVYAASPISVSRQRVHKLAAVLAVLSDDITVPKTPRPPWTPPVDIPAEPATATAVDGAPAAVVPAWLNTVDAAAYTGRHPKTVLAAVQRFQRTNGREGLEGYQRVPRAQHNIPRAALDRWMRGEPPVSRKQRMGRVAVHA